MSEHPFPFHSPAPRVRLVNAFARPYENAVATARTCYSSRGIVLPEHVSTQPELRDRVARTIYEAGHHTTFQHAHVQFALENVSRHFIWSFLHSHPFYNSEQVSQRYVRVTPDQVAVPPLRGQALEIYAQAVKQQTEAYYALIEHLLPTVERLYFERFPGRRPNSATGEAHPLARRWIPKKAQEVARYVLPVATFAYLYHTVSVLTLLRYYRLCQQYDVPTETSFVVGQMVCAVLREDPLLEGILEEPLPIEETIEYRFWASSQGLDRAVLSAEFRAEFDASLEGHTSKLISWLPDNEAVLAQAVREVLGLPRRALSDDEAIALVLDPRRNPYFGEALNVTTLSKLTRALVHPRYTFRKKLSHTADSQDQRHRMTPASRPALTAYLTSEPDYITPALIREVPVAKALYEETMLRTWEAIDALLSLGVAREYAAYLLPNAVSIRFTESADLLHLHHKLRMRLCYNAQEEIFNASLDEARQIAAVNPRIGRHLGAPCALRHAAGVTPFCPEGDRYCGVPVWRLRLSEYERLL